MIYIIGMDHGDPKKTNHKKGVSIMQRITVQLTDNTVGTIDPHSIDGYTEKTIVGAVLKVHLHDENGNPIERTGEIAEVLDWREKE